MNRTKKFIINALTTGIFQIFLMISGLIIPKVMITIYGSDINGLVTSITQFVAYITLIEAGLTSATIFSLYKPLAKKQNSVISEIITASRNFYYKTGFSFLIVILFSSLAYSLFIKVDLLNPSEIFLLFLIIGANGILEFFTLGKYRALLTADQKTYVISLASLLQVVISTIIIVVLSNVGLSIILVRFFAIISILIRTLIIIFYCKKRYSYIDYNAKPNYEALNKRWDALYLQVLAVIQKGAPVLIITFIMTVSSVSVYSVYNLVIQGIISILSIFVTGIASSFGNLEANKEYKNAKIAFDHFQYLFNMLLTIVYALTIVLYIPFIKVYIGDSADINYVYPILALLFTLNGIFYNLKTPFGMLVVAKGLYRETRLQTTIQGVILVVLGIPLTIFYGLEGVLIASILSNLYRDIEFLVFSKNYFYNDIRRKTVFRWFKTLIVIISAYFVSNYLAVSGMQYSISNWVKLAIISGILITIYTISLNIVFEINTITSLLNRFKILRKR